MKHAPGRAGLSIRARLTRGVAWILGVQVAFLILYLLGGRGLRELAARWLILTPDALAHGEVWKLLTTAAVNFDVTGQVRLLGVFFDLLMLWMFVPVLERSWGTRRFVTFAALTILAGNLAGALLGMALSPLYSLVGISPLIYASIAAFGVEFGDQQVLFFGMVPMRGRTLAIGIVVVVALMTIVGRAWVDGVGYFAAMGAAWLMTARIAMWQPNVWRMRYRRWRIRRRYRVLDGGSDRRNWMN